MKQFIFWCFFHALYLVFFLWKQGLNLRALYKRHKRARGDLEKKKVVVLGGGFAGTYIAHELERDFHVTLIDNKDCFEFTPSILRTIVEPEHLRRVQIKHCHYLNRSTFVQNEIISVTDQHVVLNKKGKDQAGKNRLVSYDYLVISTGSYYASPFRESISPSSDILATTQDPPLVSRIDDSGPAAAIDGTPPLAIELPPQSLLSLPGTPALSIVNTTAATGSSGAGATTMTVPLGDRGYVKSTRALTLRENCQRLSDTSTRTILVIGGGLVGVELAAEITEHFPDKEIIIIHSHSHLMGRMPKPVVSYAERWLERRRVKLYLDQKVLELVYPPDCDSAAAPLVARTDKGRDISADMVFLCTGIIPNSSFMKAHFAPCLTKAGFIKVNQYLQMEGRTNVFVCGDVADIQEEKLAQSAEVMGDVVANNLRALVDAKDQPCGMFEAGAVKGMVAYKSVARPILVSLGKYEGIFSYGKLCFGGFLPALLKEAVEWKTMVRYW